MAKHQMTDEEMWARYQQIHAETQRKMKEGYTKEDKRDMALSLGFIFIGIPLILFCLPYILVTMLMLGSVGADAVIGAITGLFK
jgi:hypothetical protein